MFDDPSVKSSDRFYIASSIAAFSTITSIILGISCVNLIKQDEARIEETKDGYTVCYVDDRGLLIKTSELEGSYNTKDRQALLSDEEWFKYIYSVDDLFIIGEYPDCETAVKVLEVINRYSVEIEAPTLETPSENSVQKR